MNFFNNIITIHRGNGTVINDVPASVQKKIYINDTKIPVESGDIISQELPSGLTKKMLVTNVQVYDMGMGLDHIEIDYTST
jgi:leucyl aminopeptidase (aminopeptidase T)